LRRPELTAERFIANPFKPHTWLYRTGDLGRWLPGGLLECLGRADNQVKVRGFRIELGEIEGVLGRHEMVAQCVAAARRAPSGEMFLVAYFEPRPGSTLEVADLRNHLKKELPEYMIPSAFVRLEKLPLTPNGKIDRKALPSPDHAGVDSVGTYVAPRNPVEQTLARLWSKVLKVGRVGIRDNFFELGGHSLLALRIIVEIEKAYKRRLPLATLLQAPTIGDLADVLRNKDWQPSWSCLVPIRPEGSKPPLFLLHSHGGNVLEYYPLASLLESDQPVYGIQALGLDGHIQKGQSLEAITSIYVDEIRSLQPHGPYLLGGFCFGGLLALEAAQQISSQGEEVALVVLIQTMNPASAHFDPSTSLFRRAWYRAAKRIDLERENHAHRGRNYFRARLQHGWKRAWARSAVS
jgi:acyl carrier protein